LDTDSIVSATIAADSGPLNTMTSEQTAVQSQENAITALTTDMTAIQTAANALRNATALQNTTASSSDSSVVTATTSAGSVAGSHTLVVNQLASAEMMIQNNSLGDSTALVGAGTFSYTYNGTTRTIQTSSSTTIQDFANQINDDSSNPGVTASLLNSGSGYYLSLGGNSTGKSNAITINDAQTTLSGFQTADMGVVQTAQDAQVQLDNWPATGSGQWITRSSNTISDLVPNVTFQLQGVSPVDSSNGTSTPTPTTISMTQDTSGVASGLTNFVTAYNNMVTDLATYTTYNSSTSTAGALDGDPVSSVLNKITDALTTTVPGFTSGSDTFTMAAQLGLSFDKTGKLYLDNTTQDPDTSSSAISQNYSAVLALVGAQNVGTSNSSYVSFSSAASTTAAGTYDVQVNYDDSGNITTAQVRPTGDSAWQYMDISGNTLTMTSGTMAGLTLTAAPDGTTGAHTQTATVNVKEGFAGQIYDAATAALDPNTGILPGEAKQFKTDYTNYTTEIATEQARLNAIQASLKTQYANMETTLTQIDSQTAGLQALLAQFNSGSNLLASSTGSSSGSSSSSSSST
jgi:flagellar hook-associated protein 2